MNTIAVVLKPQLPEDVAIPEIIVKVKVRTIEAALMVADQLAATLNDGPFAAAWRNEGIEISADV